MKLHCTHAACTVILLVFVSGVAAASPSFQGVGVVPGRDFSSAYAVSADGCVVVGGSKRASTSCATEAFFWEDGVITALGGLAGGGECCSGYAVSADGSIVAGQGETDEGDEAFRWAGGVMMGLGDLAGGQYWSIIHDMSADGSILVGYSISELGHEAIRWQDGQMDRLDDLPGGQHYCQAFGVTPDGSIIVGCGYGESGSEAVRWANGVLEIISDPEDNLDCCALDVTPDGSVVVGYAVWPNGIQEAVRWDDGVMTSLGMLPGGHYFAAARAVSADGTVIVGATSGGTSGDVAFIWDAEHGMRPIADVLAADYGIDVGDWALEDARGISADGMTVVGLGDNPANCSEGWVAHLPIYPDSVPALSEYGLAVLAGGLLLAAVAVVRKRGLT